MVEKDDGLKEALTALGRYPSGSYEGIGQALLQVARTSAAVTRVIHLERINPQQLGENLCRHIAFHNEDVGRRAGFPHGLRSDEFGSFTYQTGETYFCDPPAGLKLIYKPEDATDYLRDKLLRVGAIDVPETPMHEIIASLGLLPAPQNTDDADMTALSEGVTKLFPGLVVADDHQIGLVISGGEEKVPECLKMLLAYSTSHPQEVESMIREIWHAGSFCFDDFILDKERGGRAKVYKKIRDQLKKYGDSHIISISYRSRDFTKRAVIALLAMKGYVTGFGESGTLN